VTPQLNAQQVPMIGVKRTSKMCWPRAQKAAVVDLIAHPWREEMPRAMDFHKIDTQYPMVSGRVGGRQALVVREPCDPSHTAHATGALTWARRPVGT